MLNVKQNLRYFIPVRIKKILKQGYYSLWDGIDFLKGRRSKLPPRRMNFVGSSDFEEVAQEFFVHFKEKGELLPEDRVLDIGCGIGRMAFPLLSYLREGDYHGFDIDRKGIEWCQEHITPRHPNFHFTHVDLFNPYYNKKGALSSSEFQFPYSGGTFDFAFAASVFTHMLKADIIHYLREMARVLKPGGRALITFFSINPLAQENIKKGISHCRFVYSDDPDSFYSHKEIKEAEVGYREEKILEWIREAGLRLTGVYHGSWAGRKECSSYQDLFVLKK